MQICIPCSGPTSPSLPPTEVATTSPSLPVEVLVETFSFLPRASLPALALLSSNFLYAAQAILQWPRQAGCSESRRTVDTPCRRDLTSLMHTLRVPARPSAQTRAYLIVRHYSAFCPRDIQLGDIHLRRPRLSSSLGLMARPMSSPCDFRSCSMTMAIRQPSLHVPASSPHPPRQVNRSCLRYHHCCLLRR